MDDTDDEELPSRHAFFRALSAHVPNRRKAHRNVCDIFLHETLYPGQDKHWTSLETMYRDKAGTLSESEKTRFRTLLGRFHRAVMTEVDGQRVMMPQMRGAHLMLSFFKAWRDLTEGYDLPDDFSYADSVAAFETERVTNPDDVPWVNFTAALSNAGYAKNRIETRHDILMAYLLSRYPPAVPKDRDRRTFTMSQKLAIWERAGRQCEWIEDNRRCTETFPNPREADADHIVKWSEGGPTMVKNGRLLCQRHNRGRGG
jgi:hypothetical protein